jgi:hypothetical protein
MMMRLPDDLEAALRKRAADEDRTLNSIVRKALRRELGLEVEYVGHNRVREADEDRTHDDTIDTILEVLHEAD